MALYNIEGVLVSREPARQVSTRDGSTKTAQEIVIEQKNGNFTEQLALTGWDGNLTPLSVIENGTSVKVTFTLRSMKSRTGYWNTYATLQSIVPSSMTSQAPKQEASKARKEAVKDADDDFPF